MLIGGPSVPQIFVYYWEGAAKYFDKYEARKHVHQGKNIVWNEAMPSRRHQSYYIDDGREP